MKLKVYLSSGKIKKVMIPEFDKLDQQNFNDVLEKLKDEHNIDIHSITMIKEKKEKSTIN